MVAAFFQWLGGAITVLVLLVGMQTIGTIFAVAVDTNDIGELVIGLALAAALGGGALWLVALVAAGTLSDIGVGWLGICVGRHPHGFGDDDNNRARALGSVALIVTFSVWGYSIWSGATEEGDPYWVMVGLLFAAGGWLIGLMGLIPRLYFSRNPGPSEKKNAEEGEMPTLFDQSQNLVLGLVPIVIVGMAMAKCMSASMGPPIDSKGRIVLAYGDWIFDCVSPPASDSSCKSPLRFLIRPAQDHGIRIRVEVSSRTCPLLYIRDDEGNGAFQLSEGDRAFFHIPSNNDNKMANDLFIFDAEADKQYTLEFGPGLQDKCNTGIRFVTEPSSKFGQRAK